MRRLIINADDLGVHAARSYGIFEAFEQGIVTSASLIVNGNDSEHAAMKARENLLPTGLHINLTNGSPCSHGKHISTLVNRDGYFYERSLLWTKLDQGEVKDTHIQRELHAQIQWFFKQRGTPTHVDGHHHIHVHPRITPILVPLLQSYGIRAMRIPEEPLSPPWEVSSEHEQYIRCIAGDAQKTRLFCVAHNIETPTSFRGMALLGHASIAHLRTILKTLPEGTTELMVHPGHCRPTDFPFDQDPQRETELHMLVNPTLPSLLSERKIILCSFADLP